MPTPSGYTTAPVVVAPPVVESNVDDFGYEDATIPAPVVAAPVVTPPVVEPPKTDEKLLTGYGKEEEVVTPPVVTPPVVEKKLEDMTDEEKAAKEITDSVKALGNEFDKEKIAKFALDNKLTKAQLEAYVKVTKDERELTIKAQEAAVQIQRKAWKEELVKDPEFGGEHFDKNVDRVEKLLNNMPNTKKILTERGTMLPPYIMKDFLALAKLLNPTTKMVTGEPSTPPADEGNFLDDMYQM
jgi:hypothetical protein